MRCDRRVGDVCVYLGRQCVYYLVNRETECPDFWKMQEAKWE